MKTRTAAGTPRSAGITLTEILISILILGVGIVSLATLFPIGLLRLREAQRQTRSAYLFQSATADVESHGLLSGNSFLTPDQLNLQFGFNLWFAAGNPLGSMLYPPLTQDTPYYGGDAYDIANSGADKGVSASPRAVTACRSRMIRSGDTRPASISTPSARPPTRPGSRRDHSRPPTRRPRYCGPTRSTTASPALTACSG